MKIGFPRRITGRTLGLGIVAASVSAALIATSPAGAAAQARIDVAIGTISGSGTVSPGFSATPTLQQWNFGANGTVTDVNSAGSGAYSCSFYGYSTVSETLAHGAGVFDYPSSCSGPLSISLPSATYVRVGNDFTIEGNFSASDGSKGHYEANCVLEPDQTPPTPMTTYHVFCSISFEGLI